MATETEKAIWVIEFSSKAKKSLKKLPAKIKKNILGKIDALALSPTECQNVKKLVYSDKAEYRLRVGDYRVLYDLETENEITLEVVHENKILVVDILHRKDAYR